MTAYQESIAMRLRTQIQRFLVSGAAFALIGAVLAFQPTVAVQIGDEVIAEEMPDELPAVIIVDKAPASGSGQSGPWRHMLPASLAPRRG
jgi:hypothetical protein